MFMSRDSKIFASEENNLAESKVNALESHKSIEKSDDKHSKIDNNYVNIDEHRIFFISTLSTSKELSLVVFVHDQINNSFIWFENETLQTLAKNNYPAIALDLPGHGQSSGPSLVNDEERVGFLQKFIKEVCGKKYKEVVLCGVSMAGQYIMPFLKLGRPVEGVGIKGLICVSLSDTDKLPSSISLPPTIILRGEYDRSIGINARDNLIKHENVSDVVIEGAGHFCHLGKTADLFNNYVIEFLGKL